VYCRFLSNNSIATDTTTVTVTYIIATSFSAAIVAIQYDTATATLMATPTKINVAVTGLTPFLFGKNLVINHLFFYLHYYKKVENCQKTWGKAKSGDKVHL
jgi:hypothetical protein